MSVATREAMTNKRPVWAVAVQGVPFVFGTAISPYAVVPLDAGAGTRFSAFDAMRRVQTHDNIAESATIEIAALLTATPIISGQTVDLRSGAMMTGGATIKGRITTGYAGLARYRRAKLGTLATAIAASTTAATASIILWGDKTGSVTSGDYLYCGQETFRVDGAVYSGVTTKTTITAYRGQCGSDRDAHDKSLPVYQSPPYWLGRRCSILRLHVEETGYTTWFTGFVSGGGPDGPASFDMTADDFLSARSREKIKLPLFGFDQAQCPGPFLQDTDADPGTVPWIFPLSGGLSQQRAWEGGDIDDTAVPNGTELTAKNSTKIVQAGGEIVKVSSVLRSFDFGTGGQFPVALVVPEGFRQGFGSARFEDVLASAQGFGEQDPRAVIDAATGQAQDVRVRTRVDTAGEVRGVIMKSSRKPVYQLLVLGGSEATTDFYRHVAGIALALLQGGGTGTYSGESPWGAALPDSMLDLDSFTELTERFPNVTGFVILGLGGAEFSPFEAAARVLAPLNAAIIQKADGTIGVAMLYDTPNPLLAADSALTTSDLAAREGDQDLSLPTVRFPLSEAIGGVRVLFASRVSEGGDAAYIATIFDGEAASYQRKPGALLDLDCSVLQTSQNFGVAPDAVARVTAAAAARMRMFVRPWPVVEIAVKTAKREIAIGDVVQIDLTDLPDTTNAEDGTLAGFTTVSFRVLSREPDTEREIVRLRGPLYPIAGEGRHGVIAPSAVIATSVADGTDQDLTVTANIHVPSGSTNPSGTTDGAHFPLNSYVRFFKADGSGWRGSGDEAQITSKASADSFTVALSAALQADRPAADDIVELSEWPTSATDAEQKYCVHLADDGATDNAQEGDEFLPSTFTPSPVYDAEPFVLVP